MIRPPGTVRVGGGRVAADTVIEVSDGMRWLPVRGVTRAAWAVEGPNGIPRLELELEPMALGSFTCVTTADRVAWALAGITEEQLEAAWVAVAERRRTRRLIETWGWMVRSLATWGRRRPD